MALVGYGTVMTRVCRCAFNHLSPNVAIMHPIMTYLLTFGAAAPPAVHFMLRTNRKSVQKKSTSKSIQIYASLQ